MEVISIEEAPVFAPIFKGKCGKILFKLLARITGVDKVNAAHDYVYRQGAEPGPDFAKGLLDYAGVDFSIGNANRLENLPEGAFVVVANHVYGHLDGICMLDIIGHLRPETKVMVNRILMWIKGLAPSFIAVEPFAPRDSDTIAANINGIKQAIDQLRHGGPLVVFPSGAVADLRIRNGKRILEERDWQDSVIKIIKKTGVPVVPIHFLDRNSMLYYELGRISSNTRLVRLCHEFFNKRGTSPRVDIGEIIMPETIKAMDLQQLKAFLRSSVNDMPQAENYTKRSELWK